MVKHLTIRLAWHDNKWNGNVCEDPEKNVYCVGSHSLLSERLARNRDLDIEKKNKGKRIDKISDDYLPPCYWSANAFSKQALTVWHNHPWAQLSKDKVIPDKLSGYSVFTWPFRLSFVHDKKKKDRHGDYPPDLVDRLDRFQKSFTKDESIVFLYLNYDNPISADDNKFALVGCATLNKIIPGKDYSFTPNELNNIRKKTKRQTYPKLKNFPTLNWAITVSYDFDSGVQLPYHEYLEHIEKNPEDSELLDEMKVLIDDDDLRPNFTYVAMDMNDDACIYTLTLLRNSFKKIKEHGIMKQDWVKTQIENIDKLLERTWKLRGIYPSLGNVLDVVADLDKDRYGIGNEIISIIKKNNPGKDTLDIITELLTKKTIPKYLTNFSPTINDMFVNISDSNLKLFQKLSLFSLSQTQIENIVRTNSTSFRKQIDRNEIIKNPYLLCETYRGPEKTDLDELITDKKIGTFTVDIGMFPDSSYLFLV